MKKAVKGAFALLMVLSVLSIVNPVSASPTLTADRSMSGTICPGSTFTVTITLDVTGSPVNGLSITEDLSALPDGWTVAPNDGGIYNAGSKKLEYIWLDPSGSIGDKTVTYDVTVSGDATVGESYDITGKAELTPPKTTVDIGTDTVTVIVCEGSLSVTVLYPNGGESILVGTQVQVNAHATDDNPVTSVTFYYTNGTNWNPIGAGTIVSRTAKDGTWNKNWDTNGLSAGTNYVIKAVASDGTLTGEDQSDGTFSLTPSELIRVPDDYSTIQAAIDAASSGYKITVSSGTYFEHLIIDKPLKLIGEDKNTTIINGNKSGYCVHVTADNVEIGGFTIQHGMYGILLESSDSCTISENIIHDSNDGIHLTDSNNNVITNNILFNNIWELGPNGIILSSSDNNVITDNELVENGGGVNLHDSNNNLIYHNNFVDNILIRINQAYDTTGTNSWDNGPTEGGNYWSDHGCVGNPSDGSQPYYIDTVGVDHYPFQDQNGWLKGISDGNTFTNTIGMEFVSIPAGEFEMGSPSDEGSVHHVNIKNAFYMGRYEVTQKQWREIMGDNPSHFKGDDDLPVEMLSWYDVQEFIKKLNEKEGIDKYRLPSEAEWEYAARAGTTTRYSFGDSESKLGDYAWYGDNSGGKTHPIGQKKPNPWGLYDMHGNVWEWVHDAWHSDYNGAPTDGSAWEDPGTIGVLRGGDWRHDARRCWSAYREPGYPSSRGSDLGFRLLKEP